MFNPRTSNFLSPMIKGNPPPQAYTREILAQAYSWLQSQPESVKNLAQSPDALVALFNRARRGGDLAAENPVSSERFRSDLKDLQAQMANFTEPESARNSTPQQAHVSSPSRARVDYDFKEDPPTSIRRPAQIPTQDSLTSTLDPRTREVLYNVQHQFNLSSEMEALRMLVVLGAERLNSLR